MLHSTPYDLIAHTTRREDQSIRLQGVRMTYTRTEEIYVYTRWRNHGELGVVAPPKCVVNLNPLRPSKTPSEIHFFQMHNPPLENKS